MRSSRRTIACVVPVLLAVGGSALPATASAADSGAGVRHGTLNVTAPSGGSAALPTRNYVKNGSFEAPAIADGSVSYRKVIPNWATAAPSGPIEIQRGVLGAAQDGEQNIELDSRKSSTITQTVVVPRAGVPYTLRFSAAPRPGEGTAENAFSVTVNGLTYGAAPDGTEQDTLSWVGYSTNAFTPSSTTFTLSFSNVGPSNGVGALIDGVSITRS